MPDGREAHIFISQNASDRWQIEDDASGQRSGDFESAEDALASLQADVDRRQ
jgi:hypothetical protein